MRKSSLGKQNLTAQSIDFKAKAQPESDIFIAWNCFCIWESSVELQHVLPLYGQKLSVVFRVRGAPTGKNIKLIHTHTK